MKNNVSLNSSRFLDKYERGVASRYKLNKPLSGKLHDL